MFTIYLYLRILNLVLMFNNGSSLIYTNEICRFSRPVSCKVLMTNQKGNLFCEKGGQFELACFLLARCLHHARPSQSNMQCSELQNFIKGLFKNCVRSKSPLFDQPTPIIHVSTLLIIPT